MLRGRSRVADSCGDDSFAYSQLSLTNAEKRAADSLNRIYTVVAAAVDNFEYLPGLDVCLIR